MAFFIVIRERDNSLRLAEYRLESRSKVDILTNYLVKSQGLSPLDIYVAVADDVKGALEEGAKHFKIQH